MDKIFVLTVAKGSIIHFKSGLSVVLSGVPDNALELWENGSSTLLLKKDGATILEDFSKERLEKVQKLRAPLGLESEKKLIAAALKNITKVAKKSDQ